MTTTTYRPLRLVLYEGPGGRTLPAPRRVAVLEKLLKAGFQVTCPGEAGGVSAPDGSDVLVLGEAEGDDSPLKNPESSGGLAAGAEVEVRFHDITDSGPEEVLEAVSRLTTSSEQTYQPGAWKPWFPVIDFDRCTNCMQCLSFCLFDVYGVDSESNIEVRNPDKCKTNCPACSRVCPDVAILFPKYGSGPINGATVNQEDVNREKMKVDISALLGGDIYSLLRDRHEKAASRFSKERDEGKALKERMRCLKKLQGADAAIPEEVLMSLPSASEIQERAKQAQEAARQALEARERRQSES